MGIFLKEENCCLKLKVLYPFFYKNKRSIHFNSFYFFENFVKSKILLFFFYYSGFKKHYNVLLESFTKCQFFF